jgi:hypothetical protein
MSPTRRCPGASAVKSQPIWSGLLTGCSPGTVVRSWARGWQARKPSSRIRPAARPTLHLDRRAFRTIVRSSGVAYAKSSPIVRALYAVAGWCYWLLVLL